MTGFISRREPGPGARTLLLLHGTGGDENQLIEMARGLDPEATLIGVRGKVLEAGMPRYFRRLAEGVYDYDDLRVRAAELAAWLGEEGLKPIAVGYSNGANIASALLLLHPQALLGAALLRANMPLETQSEPDLTGVNVLIVNGEHDPLTPAERGPELAGRLARAGANVQLEMRHAGHALEQADLDVAERWLRKQ